MRGVQKPKLGDDGELVEEVQVEILHHSRIPMVKAKPLKPERLHLKFLMTVSLLSLVFFLMASTCVFVVVIFPMVYK